MLLSPPQTPHSSYPFSFRLFPEAIHIPSQSKLFSAPFPPQTPHSSIVAEPPHSLLQSKFAVPPHTLLQSSSFPLQSHLSGSNPLQPQR